jgi:hypothetical protein
VNDSSKSPAENLLAELRTLVEQTDSIVRRVGAAEGKDVLVLGYASLRNRLLAVPK